MDNERIENTESEITFSAPTEEIHQVAVSYFKKRYLSPIILIPIVFALIVDSIGIWYVLSDTDNRALRNTLLVLFFLLVLVSIGSPLLFFKGFARKTKASVSAMLPFLGILIPKVIEAAFFIATPDDPDAEIAVLFAMAFIIYCVFYLLLLKENVMIARKLPKKDYLVMPAKVSGERTEYLSSRGREVSHFMYLLGEDGKEYRIPATKRECKKVEIGDPGSLVRFTSGLRRMAFHEYFIKKEDN
ncbi:MAG: hypothetical protein IK109_02390 [Clostridiales bacterium]|nr:hypothetical protein [Clostridiales bacterium]